MKMFKTITAYTVMVGAVILCTPTTYAQQPKVDHTVTTQNVLLNKNTETVKDILVTSRTHLNDLQETVTAEMNTVTVTENLVTAVQQLQLAVDNLKVPLAHEVEYVLLGLNIYSVDDKIIGEIETEVASREQKVNEALTGFRTQKAVNEKQARVQNKVDELMASRSSAQPVSNPYSSETPVERVSRVMATLPFEMDFFFGTCSLTPTPNNTIACYLEGDNVIQLTQLSMNRTDCQLRSTLAHEYRHYEQFTSGIMAGSSREWLEADAEAFEANFSC